MPTSILGEVFAASACADRIRQTPWDGVAVYMLWNRETGEPVYCGTAKSAGRLRSHLKKDDPLTQPSGHNLRNPELTSYWKSRKLGWLGVSFRIYPDEEEARNVERKLIASLGIRRLGGQLFNQRLSG